ncbi:TPA_asm: hypothetical protein PROPHIMCPROF_55 [Mycobacterium phage McProf]|uniref:hypothetical protein n=1 Tax=Mycobacteroides chelonae TaxID=1774 RepID=UPI000618AD0B|nr:hypothetical protein [Mycobacteroides chelonae]VEG15725.1 Uncharacterised protein [Mycolicibacterium phlei]DAZ90043.1 TPA_asm: hypothetical protein PROPHIMCPROF_55 [Mycobacterium phage McProf]AKC38439.1 hypothetical protein GR01_07425 [Mycobacteroides chelonae]ANB00852.1 hypothetical protein BB28_07895 [Mycobacteroides chelonae CCUG 47445]OLT75207.1 hypothetical protein BKG56_15710 [Mycobacteroides chelonae]
MPNGVYDIISAELGAFYDQPDYPGARTGAGRYVDLFQDPELEHPVGRLWTNDKDACGLLHVADGDEVLYAYVALSIRRELHQGSAAKNTFEHMCAEWNEDGTLTTTNLADIEDSAIALNADL